MPACQEASEHGAALRYQGQRAARDLVHLEHGIGGKKKVRVCIDEPQAVGSQQTDAAGSRQLKHLALFKQSWLAGFGKPVAEYRRNGYFQFSTLTDYLRYQVAGDHDEGMIDRA